MGIRVQTQRGMRVLGHMVQRSHQIPQEVIGLALGICMLTIVKGAFFIGASVGRGVLIKRLSRHRWGAPSSYVWIRESCGQGRGGSELQGGCSRKGRDTYNLMAELARSQGRHGWRRRGVSGRG